MSEDVRRMAERQLDDLDPRARIVVMHPHYVQQRALLLRFLEAPGAVYMRVQGTQVSVHEARRQLEMEMLAQIGQRDLSHMHLLVLDECDRLVNGAVRDLLGQLMRQSEARIVLVGRELRAELLTDAALLRSAVFVPQHPAAMLWDYGQSGAQQNVLEVRALGAGQVILNGRVIRDWDGALPRSLFFFLVDRGMATRTEIFDTFWPQLTTREATNVFHVTKRKVNEILGLDFTVYSSGYYRISSELQLAYDALIFTQLCQLGEIEEAAEAEPALSKALSMYHGHFLSGLDMPWAVERRSELRASYGESLLALAAIKESHGEPEAALSLYVRAIAASPGNAEIVLQVMRLYDHLGMPADALAAYERYQRSERRSGDAGGLSTLAATIRTRVGERVNN